MEHKEEWRQVPEFPRYEVSSLGRIRGPRGMMTGSVNTHGYVRVYVRPGDSPKGRDRTCTGRGIEQKLHRLVASAFHPRIEGKDTVNHKDGNKLNNRPDNLEWASSQENLWHNVLIIGHKTNAARKAYLTVPEVLAIRQAHAEGETCYSIAKRLGRTYGHIRDITSRRTWRLL